MFYSFEITVPPNTDNRHKQETIAKLSHGVITRVSYRPRPGHAALCHCQVLYRRSQQFPRNLNGDLHGDSWTIEWDEWLEIFNPPHVLYILSWNDDDTYPHTFDISFTVLPKWVVLPYAFAKSIGDMIGALIPKTIFRKGADNG